MLSRTQSASRLGNDIPCGYQRDALIYSLATRHGQPSVLDQMISQEGGLGQAEPLDIRDFPLDFATRLAARAQTLRGGFQCTVREMQEMELQGRIRGTSHYFEIRFSDDVRWLARVPKRSEAHWADRTVAYIMKSEVATLQYFANTSIRPPRVHEARIPGQDSPLSVPYILMDLPKGRPLRWNGVQTPEQRCNLQRSVAMLFHNLYQHPFENIGSIVPSSSHKPCIGILARQSTLGVNPEGGVVGLGPWKALKHYWYEVMDNEVRKIVEGRLYTKAPLDACLVNMWLREQSHELAWSCHTPTTNSYLSFSGDLEDHLLVDDDFNVTGLVDWEEVFTTAPEQAFRVPMCFLREGGFDRGIIAHEAKDFVHILDDLKHDEDGLPRYIRCTSLQSLWFSVQAYDLDDNWDAFEIILGALRRDLGIDAQGTWGELRVHLLDRYRSKHPAELRELLKRRGFSSAADGTRAIVDQKVARRACI